MASVQEIRQRLRGQRIETLRSRIKPLLAGSAGAEVWLFGSLARGDWDARSDVDLLAVAPDQSAADQLAEALLGTGLADDVIGLSQGRWLQRQRGDDPLKPLQRMTTASSYPDGDEAPVDLFDARGWGVGPGGGAGRGGLRGSAAWGP